MMIPLWYGVLFGISTSYFGFWFGRSRNWGLSEMTKDVSGQENDETTGDFVNMASWQKEKGMHKEAGKPLPYVKYLASPASGVVERLEENGKIGARIETTDSKLFSPSGGRILSVAPRGNAFVILTDYGTEVEVRACSSDDDLLDRYFRPRVIRGEIIRRGKLLLEYDREKISRECDDTATYLMALGEEDRKMELVNEKQVNTGDALFWLE